MLAPLLLLALLAGGPTTAQPAEVVAEIRVHGNVVTPDEEMRRLAGIEVGAPVGSSTLTRSPRASEREALPARRRPKTVRLDRRSHANRPVIVVDEGPVKIEMTGDPDRPTRVVRSRRWNLLFLPVLNVEDGYGFTYGARAAVADPAGKASRLSFPLTWGGDKRVGAEFDKSFDSGVVSRIQAGASISRRTNPYFQQDEDRDRVWVRGEHEVTSGLRLGATGGWQRVLFQGVDDRFAQAGADVVLDTRLDQKLPRNAVYARAAWDHLSFQNGGAVDRVSLEGRGYVGLFGQNVLVLRALRDAADTPLPPYLKPMLGGMANLRGFKAGTAIGDMLVAASAELRVPLTSPLSFGKIGVSAFVDAGTVYDKGASFQDQTIAKGSGGSVWFSAAFFQFNVAVAHGLGASTRVHAGGGVSF
jgi:outer membrane protein assembly factor BamA